MNMQDAMAALAGGQVVDTRAIGAGAGLSTGPFAGGAQALQLGRTPDVAPALGRRPSLG